MKAPGLFLSSLVIIIYSSTCLAQPDVLNQQGWLKKQAENYDRRAIVVLENTHLQRVKGDDTYTNLVGVSKNDILFFVGEDDDSYQSLNGYISKSKAKYFNTMEEAETYVKIQRAADEKKAREATAKKAAVIKAEQEKKAAIAKAKQEKRVKDCVDSGAILLINNWTWGKSYGDNVSVEGLITNISGSKLDYVKIVALFFDKSNTYISSAWSYTKITTLMPYQSSPFRISWLGANPLAKYAHLKVLDRQDNEIRTCNVK